MSIWCACSSASMGSGHAASFSWAARRRSRWPGWPALIASHVVPVREPSEWFNRSLLLGAPPTRCTLESKLLWPLPLASCLQKTLFLGLSDTPLVHFRLSVSDSGRRT